MRRTIARRLVEARQTVPHFYLTADVDLTRLLALREKANSAISAKLSINDFIIKALALALQRVPAANAVWAEGGDAALLRYRHSDVGVAVAIEGGLFTPVIRKAETKSLSTISAEMKDLAARARERRLHHQPAAVDDAGGRSRPAPPRGSSAFATLMTVTLSCDHRVVDGARGAQLLAAFKAAIGGDVFRVPQTDFRRPRRDFVVVCRQSARSPIPPGTRMPGRYLPGRRRLKRIRNRSSDK